MWKIQPHTRAKHQMLDVYLKGWYPRLAKHSGEVLYFDGFAGRGRYTDGSPGSPFIALDALIRHTYLPQMISRRFSFYFVEATKENATHLQQELDTYEEEVGGFAKHNVGVKVIVSTFERATRSLAGELRRTGQTLPPTFALIDPFGYSGLPMEAIAELFSARRSEVFVNFMVGHVMRFLEREGQEDAISTLFGMPAKEVMAGNTTSAKRVEYLKEVYEQQLKQRAGFEYVRSFAMKNATGNVSYYLVHGTHHREGVKLMKAAMWKVDAGAGQVFTDRLADHEVLFAPQPNLFPLEDAMLRHFSARKNVLVDEIEWFVVLETPYRETHVRPVLAPLEASNIITVRRPGARGYPKDTTHVDFPEWKPRDYPTALF
jgi:three-Cys-motif partner protein